MLRKFVFVVIALMLLVPALNVVAQPSGLPVTVPREELFVMDQIFRWSVIDNYNIWGAGRHDAAPPRPDFGNALVSGPGNW